MKQNLGAYIFLNNGTIKYYHNAGQVSCNHKTGQFDQSICINCVKFLQNNPQLTTKEYFEANYKK